MSVARSIVYFAYLGDEETEDGMVRRRLAFMDRQLRWLADLVDGAGEATKMVVSYVAPRHWDADLHRAASCNGFEVDAESVRADRRNTFEYRGFVAMKTLARSADPESLIYYCHSKGIVYLEEPKMGLFRLHTAVGLTANLTALIEDPNLSRATIFPYKFGWCWYNFFWIKAGYMAGLTVEESTDRHHFEALVGDRRDKEGYRGVLPLIDQIPFADTGIAVQPWYRPEETTSPTLTNTYDRYAGMASPTAARRVSPTDTLATDSPSALRAVAEETTPKQQHKD